YVPIETILSKWYGEAEQNLSKIFEKTSLLGKAIIFIDEIDALAVARNCSETHEVSRRLVSVLLRKLDFFESDNNILLICATNRKDALDPAILSRLDMSITFDLPDKSAREEIFKRYAK
ncbi:MAG: AAA family ATPase, partial [Candidatus Gracilibacteria bacterium]|nr:AAA family ATPase [Candidatus Gracilibacteria bacterium]